jgi:hypothetical protein
MTTETAVAPPKTLDERVEAILGSEEPRGIFDAASSQPADLGEHECMSTYELNLLEWGMIVGLAFGIARLEEPCECMASVARRAREAAEAVYARQYQPLRFADRGEA